MRFRNIWYRELPPRPIEGGTDGYLNTEATMVKRRDIAASIRHDAERLSNSQDPVPQMLRLMESLEYENLEDTAQKVDKMANAYVASLKELPADQLASKKDEVKRVSAAFKYLARFKITPSDLEPAVALDKMIKDQGWDKKKND
jgi:hypothetical protein